MAKALKLPRTFKGGAGREVAQSSTTRSVQEILRVSPAPELEENRQASVGRLTQLCQRPSAADSSLRMERIAAIQKSIAAGTHRISAADLADKLIAHMLMNRSPRS